MRQVRSGCDHTAGDREDTVKHELLATTMVALAALPACGPSRIDVAGLSGVPVTVHVRLEPFDTHLDDEALGPVLSTQPAGAFEAGLWVSGDTNASGCVPLTDDVDVRVEGRAAGVLRSGGPAEDGTCRPFVVGAALPMVEVIPPGEGVKRLSLTMTDANAEAVVIVDAVTERPAFVTPVADDCQRDNDGVAAAGEVVVVCPTASPRPLAADDVVWVHTTPAVVPSTESAPFAPSEDDDGFLVPALTPGVGEVWGRRIDDHDDRIAVCEGLASCTTDGAVELHVAPLQVVADDAT